MRPEELALTVSKKKGWVTIPATTFLPLNLLYVGRIPALVTLTQDSQDLAMYVVD